MTIGESDEGFVPDTEHFIVHFLLKCGDPENWFRACSAAGVVDLPADGVETEGGRYYGIGRPSGYGALSSVINGEFSSVDFTLAGPGLDLATVQLANVDRHLVNNSEIRIGIQDLEDGTLAPVAGVDWITKARAGMPIVRKTTRVDDQGKSTLERSITLPGTTAFKDRRLAPTAYLSGIGQRARSSDDASCDRTSIYYSGTTEKWPN